MNDAYNLHAVKIAIDISLLNVFTFLESLIEGYGVKLGASGVWVRVEKNLWNPIGIAVPKLKFRTTTYFKQLYWKINYWEN